MGESKQAVVEGRIREAIAGLRPLLHVTEPESVELLRFDLQSGVAVLRLDGGCPDCDMPATALMQGIEAHLRLRVPEIHVVRCESSSS
jgi:Fe-S cluster biogenesis protein NfuA